MSDLEHSRFFLELLHYCCVHGFHRQFHQMLWHHVINIFHNRFVIYFIYHLHARIYILLFCKYHHIYIFWKGERRSRENSLLNPFPRIFGGGQKSHTPPPPGMPFGVGKSPWTPALGGGRCDPHPKSSVFISKRTFLDQNYEKLKFKQLFYVRFLAKNYFWITFWASKLGFQKKSYLPPPLFLSLYIRAI